MLKVKRVMTKQSEEDVSNIILEHVEKNNMTISNLKQVIGKVINYMESNAILEMEENKKETAQEVQAREQLNRFPVYEEITMESKFDYEGYCPMLEACDLNDIKK